MKLWKKVAAALSLGVACAAASASPWVDTMNLEQKVPPARSYTHDLTARGFVPGVDAITSLTLEVTLRDDATGRLADWPAILGGDGLEAATIDPEGNIIPILWDNWFVSDEIGPNTVATMTWSGNDWTLLFSQDGLFSVTVSSLWGDFYLVSSTLTAIGTSASVPVPGALALMGIGLVGLAGFLRRSNA